MKSSPTYNEGQTSNNFPAASFNTTTSQTQAPTLATAAVAQQEQHAFARDSLLGALHRQIVERGCTPEEASHALDLLCGMGIPTNELERWVNDLWALVETALDDVLERDAS